MNQNINQFIGKSVPNSEHVELDTSKDRKRLKERLQKAVMKGTKTHQTVGFLEYVFGINAGDQRMGKEGSR